jgi:hypothetical protein
MAKTQLERRVATLEQQVAELRSQMPIPAGTTKDIRKLIGVFDGDEVMGDILAEALKFRERDRQKARRRIRGLHFENWLEP